MSAPPGSHDSISISAVEAGATLIAITFAFAWPRVGSGFFVRIERAFSRLAEKKGMSIAIVGLSVIALRLALMRALPDSAAFVPDDFQLFLLASDTFAHGRLANLTPLMWTATFRKHSHHHVVDIPVDVLSGAGVDACRWSVSFRACVVCTAWGERSVMRRALYGCWQAWPPATGHFLAASSPFCAWAYSATGSTATYTGAGSLAALSGRWS